MWLQDAVSATPNSISGRSKPCPLFFPHNSSPVSVLPTPQYSYPIDSHKLYWPSQVWGLDDRSTLPNADDPWDSNFLRELAGDELGGSAEDDALGLGAVLDAGLNGGFADGALSMPLPTSMSGLGDVLGGAPSDGGLSDGLRDALMAGSRGEYVGDMVRC